MKLVADYAILGVDHITADPHQPERGVFLTLRTAQLAEAGQSNTPGIDQARQQTIVMSHAVLMDLLSVLNAARENLGIAEQAAAPGTIVPPKGSKH